MPIVIGWLKETWSLISILYIVIDRTQWACINVVMISLIVDNRSIPLYFELLDHTGSSNVETQKALLSRVLPLLKEYKTVVLGDREFCSVELAKGLNGQKKTYFCLTLRKSTYIAVEEEMWISLKNLGLEPGMS